MIGDPFSSPKAAFQDPGRAAATRGTILRQFGWTRPWVYFYCAAIMILLFGADIMLPRGATEAIGYCLVLVVAAGARRRGFLLSMAITCTVLTWIAVFFEAPGHSLWRLLFDRAIVTGVIWLAYVIVLRRATIIGELVHQTSALNETLVELERSNEELANFASAVAHDLRGPLNTIGLFTQLLSSGGSNQVDAEQAEWLSSIQNEITHMSRLIEGLLAYGRIGSGELKLQACDCMDVLRNVQQILRADLSTNQVHVTSDALPVVLADPLLMARLFQNLIENSIKYRGEAPPHIRVSAVQMGDLWQFSVKDNGMGLRPEDCKRIFDPFRQTEAGKSRGRGVGLGLAMCKKIVERHGGGILAQSGTGDGTTFLFTIPGSPASGSSATPEMRPGATI